MSPAGSDQVRCRRCDADISPGHAYCGACGQALGGPEAGGARRVPRLLVFSAGLCLVATVVALGASFATTQAGPWGFGFGIADAMLDTNFSGDGGDSSVLVTIILLVSFVVAALSFVVFVWTGTRLLVRRARRGDYSQAARMAAEAAERGRRTAAAAMERGSREYADAKPKVAEAARRGRERLDEQYAEAKPRVADAARKGRERLDEQYAEAKPRVADAARKGRERLDEQYPKAIPKVTEAARKGRRLLNEDVAPRAGKAAAQAGRAATKGRAWVQERRDRRNDPS
jgi:hypothetical protein